MTTFLISQEALAKESKTIIKSIDGTPKYIIVGKWGLRGNVLSIYSMSGDLLANVKKFPNALGTRFDLYEKTTKVGTMRRVLHLHFDFYYISSLKWHVLGDVYKHHYMIRTFSEIILEMDTSYSFEGEFYKINIPKEELEPLALCVASVLDYWSITSFKDPLKKWNIRPSFSPGM